MVWRELADWCSPVFAQAADRVHGHIHRRDLERPLQERYLLQRSTSAAAGRVRIAAGLNARAAAAPCGVSPATKPAWSDRAACQTGRAVHRQA